MENKKNYTGLIIGVAVAGIIGIIILSSLIVLYFAKDETKTDAFKEQLTIYDKYKKVSEKVNSIINTYIKDYEDLDKIDGIDKDKLKEIKEKQEEIRKHLIDINNNNVKQTNKLKKINEDLNKALKEIDEELVNISDEDLNNYVLKNDSEIKLLIDRTNALITSTKNQIENQKIISEVTGKFDGNYSYLNQTETCLVIKDNSFILQCGYDRTYKFTDMEKITKKDDGSYVFTYKTEPVKFDDGSVMNLSKSFNVKNDGTEIIFCEDLGCLQYVKQ